MSTLTIRGMSNHDVEDALRVNREAFGSDIEAKLVEDLLADLTARPVLSLLAIDDGTTVGHILFTKAKLDTAPAIDVRLLAPMAVIPSYQKKGIGGRLIEEGISRLEQAGVSLVFVLGHPTYYPRFGFTPAGIRGFAAPYPIQEKDAGAWMVRTLRPDAAHQTGTVRCADEIMRPEYWHE